ncbi:DNA repair protein RecN [Conexibacter sp. JD483]|uniref:DNA repair protein RecN n=1 Tax=unclassified Conexibacter TaxID=2627773 RepID=UPI002723CE0F|nr:MULTISPECIES: DNA repair protein RecN [unclassified Conexibacter]MDO8185081.1 DNA repair protein RecN [Conexibacter sp. CPCC 205706]MDO8196791.1 DNA repair protein RecN [Conexibacter sp. CPCC 205762]MDR9368039.1 DNA repair protein RecN [Conexibacter sp. JD483]
MLHELRVENLLLIERAELRLGPGLNVLTGETGAGKTMLAHALDLLLGGKARSGIVRPGAAEAYVEGVFDFPDRLRAELGDRLPDDADELVLARRVWPDGRTRAYLNGRSATVADLRELGGELLAFYGQHEHRRLTLASAQLEIVDGFCGPEQRERRVRAAAAHAALRALTRRAEELGAIGGARERELDLLEYELREIEEVDPDVAEQAGLTTERERLRHLEGLRGAAFAGAEAIAPENGEEGASARLARAGSLLDAIAGVDPELEPLIERYRALALEADDLATELRGYEQAVEGQPGRLDEVEERLTALGKLERKHGGSIEAVLAHADDCRARRDELLGAEAALEATRAELDEARAKLDKVARELRGAREAAAPGLAAAVRERLAELAMAGATFEVALNDRDEPNATGGDTVELLIAANPGVPAGPLRDVASGGETSRVMLALLGVANASVEDGAGLLVFDEIDAGIGGRTANAVGSQLRALAAGRQVLCITHLPQVAAYAERHFRIEKDGTTETAVTTVTDLRRDAVLGELVRMLGAEETDRAARRHARELLKAA